MDYDVLVLGGGIIGCAAAYELSKYNLNIAVIEKEYDIADDISFVNTAIVYDGSETSNNVMSGLEYIGNTLLENLCSRFNVPFKRIGALRVVNDDNGVLKLKEMYDRAVKRGIDDICLINGDEVKKIEPNINTDIKKGLYSKNVAIVAPYDLAIAYAEVASENGVNFRLEEEVLNIEKINKGFRVATNRNKFTCKVVINTIADEIYINEKGVVKEKISEAEEDSFKNMSYILVDDKYKNKLNNDLCIGLSNNNDVLLLRIINKIINSISAEELNTIVYKNTLYTKNKITLQSFIYSNYIEVMIFIISILAITSLSTYIIMKIRLQNKNKQNSLLKEKSETDSLTGIFNRGACKELVSNYIENKSNDLYGAFFIIDIDNFKGVNDNLGHKIGDDVLKDLADNLKRLFRKSDIVGRWGGDEFIVFMKDLDFSNLHVASKIATNLCNTMNKTVTYNDISQNISLSIGIVFTKDNINFTELYQKADEILYTVKENGKNGFSTNILNN